MKNPKTQHTFGPYRILHQLMISREKLKNYVYLFETRGQYHADDIASRLNILFFDNNRGKRLPLIQEVARLFNLRINLHSHPRRIDEKIGNMPTPTWALKSGPVGWFTSIINLIPLAEALNVPQLLSNGKTYTLQDQIRTIRNKLDGSHFDYQLTPEEYALHHTNLIIGGIQSDKLTIVQFGVATIRLIELILRVILDEYKSPFVNHVESPQPQRSKQLIEFDALVKSANIDYQSGNFFTSLEQFRQALQIAWEIKDGKAAAYCFNLMGNCYSKLKAYDDAFRSFDKARGFHKRHDWEGMHAFEIYNIGSLQYELGYLERGLHNMNYGISIVKQYCMYSTLKGMLKDKLDIMKARPDKNEIETTQNELTEVSSLADS